uniref:Thymidylate kinase n=1 Tax=Gasterosteus aculeatus aculeatus TaxID=481459 RepID=G3NKU1_GASAC
MQVGLMALSEPLVIPELLQRWTVVGIDSQGHQEEVLAGWREKEKNDRSTTIGQLISAYLEKKSDLEDHTVHLLFSANRWERVPLMKKKLEEGITLVVDRYAFSGAAFTSAKPGFSLDWCMKPDVGLPKPDLVMFLQLSPAEAALRGQFGEERYETSAFQRAVQQQFEELRKDSTVNWQVIDASQSVDDVHKSISSHSLHTVSAAQSLPLGELWK